MLILSVSGDFPSVIRLLDCCIDQPDITDLRSIVSDISKVFIRLLTLGSGNLVRIVPAKLAVRSPG